MATCENCAAISAFRAEFSEVKTDIKLIIRLISMLLADNSTTRTSVAALSVRNNASESPENQPSSGSSVSSEAYACGEQQQEAPGSTNVHIVEPAILSNDEDGPEAIDAAAMITVKCEEISDYESPVEACQINGAAYGFTSQFDNVATYSSREDLPTTSCSADFATHWSTSACSDARPFKRLKATPANTGVMCVGEDPNVTLPVAEYTAMVQRSNNAAMLLLQLVTATIPDTYNYTFERAKGSLATCVASRSKDGRVSLREHPTFMACVSQTIKEFGVFEFDDKLKQSLYKKCYRSCQKMMRATNLVATAEGVANGEPGYYVEAKTSTSVVC